MHYPKGENVEVSYGILLDIKDAYIRHLCNIDYGSSGAPILSLKTFKVIGIHIGGIENNNTNKIRYNKGTFIKYAIQKLNEYYTNINKITIICKEIHEAIPIFGQIFVENNIANGRLIKKKGKSNKRNEQRYNNIRNRV